MLHKVRIICPMIATYVINSYSQETRLFISGGEEITLAECTTQDDPTAMLIYALGSLSQLNITTTDNTRTFCVCRWYKLCRKTKEHTNLVE